MQLSDFWKLSRHNTKPSLAIILVFLLGIFCMAEKVRTAEASGTIYIQPDGSVDPSTAPIFSLDKVTYIFEDDVNDSVVIRRSNIVIDGAGHVVEGNGTGKGFTLSSIRNVTIRNTAIKGFEYGVYLQSAFGNTVLENSVTNNSHAFGLFSSSNNSISGNSITNSGDCFWLMSSSYNTLVGNGMNGNKYSFYLAGFGLGDFVQFIDVSNTIDGKPVYYFVGKKDLLITPSTVSNIGFLGVVNSQNVSVEGLTLTNSWQGILLAYTNSSGIRDNNISSNYYGVWLFSSFGNSFSSNNITNNQVGTYFDESSNNTFSENSIMNNSDYGIHLSGSSDCNNFSENDVIHDRIGAFLERSSNNTLSRSTITDNSLYGVHLFESSNYNIIKENKISGSEHGVFVLESSNYNRVFQNNITSNGIGAYLDFSSNYNNISQNHITANSLDGVVFDESSSYNSVSKNEITRNQYGIYLNSFSNYNRISGNNLTNNRFGMCLDFSVNYNNVSRNNFANSEVGIEMGQSSGNKFFHNNFIGNMLQVDVLTLGYPNSWDDGYPSGGNYWSDYTGTDEDKDGLGDAPYIIDNSNRDNYPLMNPIVDVPENITPPAIFIVSPENKTYGTSTVPLIFTVDESPFWIGFRLDGNAVETIGGNTSIVQLEGGTHRITVFANDSAGNIGSSGTVYFTIDTVPPEIAILSPMNKKYAASSVPLEFVVDEATSWIAYSLDRQNNKTISGNTTLTGLDNGSHSLIIYANDTAGNMGYVDTSFFIDTTPPAILVLSPENKTYSERDVPLSFRASESVPWVAYSLDGLANVTINGNTTLLGLSDGSHTVVVSAVDTAGNTGSSETIHFNVRIPPQLHESLSEWIAYALLVVLVIAGGFLFYFRVVKKKRVAGAG